jgi:hypothetical protein
MGLPAGSSLTYTPVATDVDGEIAHVQAFRPMALTGAGLQGLEIRVPAVARVRTRGRSVVGVLGDTMAPDAEVEREARAFATALVANGDLIGAPREGTAEPPRRRTRGARASMAPPPPRPATAPFPPTHEVRQVDGRMTIERIGFA